MAESNLMEKTGSLIEQLGKAFLELESHKEAAEDKVLWKEIEEHFRLLETTMVKKFLELEVREKAFKEEESEFLSFLEVREADVAAKEQDMMDHIQELKNAAVAAIAEIRAAHPSASLEDVVENKESKVSSSLGDKNPIFSAQQEYPHETGENDGVAGKPCPKLTQFCGRMDAKGLLNFIMENHKNTPSIRDELSVALESATEPGRLVLASLEGFYPPPDCNTQEGNKKDAALQGMRQSCRIILEAMATLLAKADPSADHLLNPEIKQQAKAIADEWKPKLADAGTDVANGNSLEAEAFLQILATFRIASEFDDDELCKLVLAVVQKRQLPELCHSLGLAHKMPGIVQSLINSGKQIDAVHLAYAFQLTESFPLVPLLKTYLKDLRRNSQGKGGNPSSAAGAQNDANAQELAALKAVIRCVQDYKLKADYPLDPLQRRVAQLEKARPGKKRVGDSGKHQQSKKPRANGSFHGYRPPPAAAATAKVVRQAPPVFGERAYAGLSDRFPHAVPNTYSYQAPTQAAYGQPGYDHRSFYYPHDERDAGTTYNTTSMGSGMPSSHQPYI